MLICLDYVIEEAKFTVVLSNGPLLMGIGLIPANFVNQCVREATTPPVRRTR